MNPNSYGQPQQSAQGWPPQQQPFPAQQQQDLPPPPSSSTGGAVNGNYQQQLASSMSGMSINSTKLPFPRSGPAVNLPGVPPTSLSSPGPTFNGPPNDIITSPSSNNNVGLQTVNNNPTTVGKYSNGQGAGPSIPPRQSYQAGVPPTTIMAQQSQMPLTAGAPGMQMMAGQPPINASNTPPTAANVNHPTSIRNQMTLTNANIPGMPHMPPPNTAPQQVEAKYASNNMQPPQVGPSQGLSASMYLPPPLQANQQQMPLRSGQMNCPPQHSTHPGQVAPQPSQVAPQPGQVAPQPGHMTHQSGQIGPHPGQMPPQPGPMPPLPGQMPHQPGQMPPQPGQMPPLPGQMPHQPGQMPPQPGQMPPLPGQMPSQPGHVAPISNQMASQQSHMVPQSSVMAPQPGQMMAQPPSTGQMPPQLGQMQMPPMSGQQPQQIIPGQMPFQQSAGGPMQYQQQQPGHMPPYPQPGQQMMSSQTGQPMTGRPGYNQPQGMYQQPQQQYQQPQQQYQQTQARRLDPDQMPNPIQVMIENQRNAGGAFVTNQPGLVPPLVTTKYVVQDQGNSSPRFLRSSLYCVPATADLLKTTSLPFSLIVSPFACTVEEEYEPPVVDFGELGPIRCNRCKAYMSPNMQFIDAGRRFQCLMCRVSTEVPQEYFQHLDHTGQRVDKYERPELVLGTYEFNATKDYCRNNTPPEIPAFIFVIDVSYNTMKSGLVHLLCSEVKRILKHLPLDQGHEKSKMRVGFITYNSTVHFYNIKSSLAQPQMMVVGDVQDMFMPLLDGFLCNPEESEAVIDALMDQIPKMFVDTKETETILYPAIQAGLEALKASNCAGKLLVFNSSLPIADAPGKLKNRDDRKLLGTEKEKTVLIPQTSVYNTLGQECVQSGCSVDLFVFNNSYIDIATIGQVARLTGGGVFKYTYFQADTDGKRLIEDIIKNISLPIGFDAVMRVRSSAGIRATDFYGHFFMSNTTDVELASIDAAKSVAIEIKHDDKLPPEENVYLQIALLYTSCSGQRRLRILNLALRTATTIADVFKSCDLDAIILFFAKQSMFKLMELTPKSVKDNLIHRTAQILACYRKHCTSPTSAGQLILPECLKLLPLYLSCLIKNDAISGGSDMTLDDRSYVIQFVLSMDLPMSVNYFYPRFIPIHNVDVEESDLPMSMRCTHEKMSEDGAYILENGVYLFIWLGQSLPQTFIQPLFGVQCTQQVNAERFAIVGETPLARRVRHIIDTIMSERTRYMRITCIRQNDKLESIFRHFLIEDRGTDGSASYVDFLCHMHKEIKDLLS